MLIRLGKSRDVTEHSTDKWNYYIAGEEIITEDRRFYSLDTLAKDTVETIFKRGFDISCMNVVKYEGGVVHCPSWFVQHTSVTDDEMAIFLQHFLRSYNKLKQTQSVKMGGRE